MGQSLSEKFFKVVKTTHDLYKQGELPETSENAAITDTLEAT